MSDDNLRNRFQIVMLILILGFASLIIFIDFSLPVQNRVYYGQLTEVYYGYGYTDLIFKGVYLNQSVQALFGQDLFPANTQWVVGQSYIVNYYEGPWHQTSASTWAADWSHATVQVFTNLTAKGES
jgi:hypothetical protein